VTDQQPALKIERAVTRRMAREGHRSLVASVVPILPAFAILFFVDSPDHLLADVVLYVLAYWALWCTCQTVATYLVFGRCDAQTFAERIDASRPERREAWRMLLGLDEGAVSLGTQLGAVMAAVTLFVFLTPPLRSNTPIVVLAACSVVSSWLLTAFSYAITYARADQLHEGLEFPGDEPVAFSDYLYYAICVNATFATSDVSVVSRRMRRLTTTHTLIAFGFNTVIFALLITLLTGTRL
jgi:hypothetical protein